MLKNFVIVLINRWKVIFSDKSFSSSTFLNTDIWKLLSPEKEVRIFLLHWEGVAYIKDPWFLKLLIFFFCKSTLSFLTITCLFEKATNAFSAHLGTWIILFLGKHSHSLDPFTPKISSVILLTVCHTILMM